MCRYIRKHHNPPSKEESGLPFTYFTGNAPEQEQICYAISTDGFSYTPLNDGNPVISSDTISLKKAYAILIS